MRTPRAALRRLRAADEAVSVALYRWPHALVDAVLMDRCPRGVAAARALVVVDALREWAEALDRLASYVAHDGSVTAAGIRWLRERVEASRACLRLGHARRAKP